MCILDMRSDVIPFGVSAGVGNQIRHTGRHDTEESRLHPVVDDMENGHWQSLQGYRANLDQQEQASLLQKSLANHGDYW